MNESVIFINQTIALINYYSFDLGEYTAKELIIKWSKKCPHYWLPLAVIEAIYQGRLKAISVQQILNLWNRHGYPSYHFSAEFERLISNNIVSTWAEIISLDEHDNNLHEEKDTSQEVVNSANSCPQETEINDNITAIVVYESPIKKFQPLEDYSHCYSQLKSLVQKNFDHINLTINF